MLMAQSVLGVGFGVQAFSKAVGTRERGDRNVESGVADQRQTGVRSARQRTSRARLVAVVKSTRYIELYPGDSRICRVGLLDG